MSTVIRSKISEANPYYISQHRYYELKHFCLQYPEWIRSLTELGIQIQSCKLGDVKVSVYDISDPVEKLIEQRDTYISKIELINRASNDTDPVLGRFVLTGVTKGLSYDCINAKETVPCCKDVYYNFYRKFFWILSQIRN